jgi:AmmeMemoRadiSam system protein B
MKKTLKVLFGCLFVFIMSGCGESSPVSVGDEKNEVQQYQISAPWDKDFLTKLYTDAPTVPEIESDVVGGIVPHHLLAGKYIATFFETLKKQKPSVVVIIGPDHFSRGRGKISATARDWKTPFGVVQTDTKLLNTLKQNTFITIDEEVISEEHSVYGIVPFIARSLPKAEVITFALRGDLKSEEIQAFAKVLHEQLPDDAVVVASIDFSHYQRVEVADFHDELSRAVIQSFEYDRLKNLEIDSIPSLETLLRYLESRGAQNIAASFSDNSERITGARDVLETTSYFIPFFVTGEKQSVAFASTLNFGDMMLDRSVAKAMGDKGIPYLLDPLAGNEGRFFAGVDITAANLEGPFADVRRPTEKSIAFRFDPILIPQLRKYGFNLFTLANNHSVDMAYAGDTETRDHLHDAGIDFYGHQYKVADDSYLLKEVGGLKLAYVGINDTHPNTDIASAIELVKKGEQEADFVIVNIHWGVEYQTTSHPRQQTLAHQFIDAGADVILGHHPHVTQEIEVYQNRPIFYSMGNFIFDQYFSVPTQEGYAVGLTFDKGENKKIHAYLFPLQGEKSAVRLKSPEDRRVFIRTYFDEALLSQYTENNSYLSFTF